MNVCVSGDDSQFAPSSTKVGSCDTVMIRDTIGKFETDTLRCIHLISMNNIQEFRALCAFMCRLYFEQYINFKDSSVLLLILIKTYILS